ncbi:MAG TPA: SEC-C metal-binding domain-containing protein [Candidatus Limnocylindrales bacterium]
MARELTGLDTDGALEGPEGWLAFEPGMLVRVRVAGGRLAFSPGDEPDAASRLAARGIAAQARTRLDALAAGCAALGIPSALSIEALLLFLLAGDPEFLARPLPPLGEAFVDAGLEVHRGHVGTAGADWMSLDEMFEMEEADEFWDDFDGADDLDEDLDGSDDEADWQVPADEEMSRRMADHYNLSANEEKAFEVILGCFELDRRQGDLDGVATYAGLAGLVGIDAIARTLARHIWYAPDMEAFVDRIANAAAGKDAAGARFLQGVCAEARGDMAAAERLLRSALAADPTFELALLDLARRETIGGRYSDALDHLRTAGVPTDDVDRAWLEAIVRPAFPATGRNEPCPCGSGRKYKHCHLDRSGDVMAVEPHHALRHKLDIWLSRSDTARTVAGVFMDISKPVGRKRAKGAPADESPNPELIEELSPVLLPDIALYDRGELARFIEIEGPNLPAAEAALANSWLGTRRTLAEVESVRRGKGLTIHDMLAPDDGPIELSDVSLSMGVEPLDVICVRLMPDGHGSVYSSDAVGISRNRRSAALDLIRSGDGVALARWIATPAAPPVLQNTEGEPMALINATYRLPDADAAAAALSRKLRDEGEGRFVEWYEGHGREWIRGSIVIVGDVATLDTNSVKRAARLERTLLRAAPGARLIKRDESGIDELLAEARSGRRPAKPSADQEFLAHSPEVAAAMAEAMRGFEKQWLDEPIPALGGLTPRQAAADKAARRELDALLKDLEWNDRKAGPRHANQGTVDPARLRAMLGL